MGIGLYTDEDDKGKKLKGLKETPLREFLQDYAQEFLNRVIPGTILLLLRMGPNEDMPLLGTHQ